MSEVCTPPKIRIDKHGEEWATFGPHHTLSDICRWLMQNRVEAEIVRDTLTEMLDGTYGKAMQ
jgi:hypothetical protein